jgi:chromatin remodeling complex protein RSC6
VSHEEESRYTSIIDAILATADLNTVTRKKIRLGLEKALGGKDLSEQKVRILIQTFPRTLLSPSPNIPHLQDAIKKLIEARFDAISSNDSPPSVPIALPPSSMPEPSADAVKPSPKRQANGHSEDTDDDDADGEIEVTTISLPAKKKQKRGPAGEDDDAKLAAELQAQENRMARSRTTRGGTGGTGKVTKKKKKTPRKKSDKKVKGEDDSEVEDTEDSAAPKRKAGGGFQKPFNLSYALAEVVGTTQVRCPCRPMCLSQPAMSASLILLQLSRPQVVKKLWEHIKANDLQDPKDKRQIRCDDKMQAVFKQAKVDMFQMNKIIGNHLYPVDEE